MFHIVTGWNMTTQLNLKITVTPITEIEFQLEQPVYLHLIPSP